MATPPTFGRSLRLNPNPPQREINIAAPLSTSSSYNSLLMILLPAVVMAGAMAALGLATGRLSSLMFTIPMMLASALAAVVGYVVQKRRDEEKARKRKHDYTKLLSEHARELQALTEEQQHIEHRNDPHPDDCLIRVQARERNLWNRSPGDDDFLALRLGLGTQLSSVTVKAPQSPDATDKDPLIKRAQEVADQFRLVPDMPVRLELTKHGITGIVGTTDQVCNATRALVIQLATHHAPNEVKLAAVYHTREHDQWEWLRWLPHVWTSDHKARLLAADAPAAHRLLLSLDAILDQRRQLAKESHSGDAKPVLLPVYVLLLLATDLVENEAALHRLMAEGPELGIYPVFLSDQSRNLPPTCRAYARIGDVSTYIAFVDPPAKRNYRPDDASLVLAQTFARTIAPIRLKELAGKEIPTGVSLLDMLGVKRVDDLDIEERWQRSQTAERSLVVPIGLQAGREVRVLDLHERAHGPNGLVAGMVGAGKSELLQTLVAALAINYHPHRVSFVLVDFKGGGMADPFVDLPHTLGIITNLQQGNLAARALTSFRVEAERRQWLFKQAAKDTGVDVNHIDAYQRLYYEGRVQEPMPYLVIIVDEFAEMKTEQPEVAKEFIKIARLGRALGFRLILAMQKPAGIVDGQIEANTRFRLCLRVAQTEDSQAMLKRPDAALLTGIGRAFLQVGANEIYEQFQVAWSGAAYDPDGILEGDPRAIKSVALDGAKKDLYSPSPPPPSIETTQLQAVTAHLRETADRLSVKALPGLWLPPLPARITLAEVREDEGWNGREWGPASKWLAPVVGLMDNPAAQQQDRLRIEFGDKGHLAIYGAPGMGKTTLVQTLVTSLALSYSPADVNIYLLDFGGRLLKMFEPLPHVGGVVVADEEERLHRFLDLIIREMDRRRVLFGAARVGTLAAYRAGGGESLPAIVIIIDNFANFYGTYENDEETIVKIARDGGNLGIHLVLTATSASALRFRVTSNITMAVALNLLEKGDYGAIMGRIEGLVPEPLPGRGLVRLDKGALEFQTALPGGGSTDFERAANLRDMMDAMASAWTGPRARPIHTLPEVVSIADVVAAMGAEVPVDGAAASDISVPLGLRVSDLAPLQVALSMGPNFLVTGPGQSGKTTLLVTWLRMLVARCAPATLELYVLDSRKMGLQQLSDLSQTKAYAADTGEVADILRNLEQQLDQRAVKVQRRRRDDETGDAGSASRPALVLVVEDLFDPANDITTDADKERIGRLLRRGGALGFHVIATGGISDLAAKGWAEPVKPLKDAQTGFMMGSANDAIFNLKVPPGEWNKMIALGEGYWILRGASQKVKIAVP